MRRAIQEQDPGDGVQHRGTHGIASAGRRHHPQGGSFKLRKLRQVSEDSVLPLEPPLVGRLDSPARTDDGVRRERLLRRLQTDADVPVIVVRAPAGYGKTTLLAAVRGR